MKRNELLLQLKPILRQSRYEHTLRTEKQALILAQCYGVDKEKTSLAALLHDCAKNLDEEQAAKYAYCLDEETKNIQPVIHALLSAEMAKTEFGVDDEEVLDAIRYHTTGRDGMTLLEKIVYIADGTEEGRAYKGVEELRKLSQLDLDQAMIKSLSATIRINQERERPIHSNTHKALEYFLKGECNDKK